MRIAIRGGFCVRLALALVLTFVFANCDNAQRDRGAADVPSPRASQAPAAAALPADVPSPRPSEAPAAAEPPTAPSMTSTSAASTPASLDLPTEEGSSGCNLSVFGGTDRRAFDAFDARLRSAAGSNDPNAFADLVAYPLSINHGPLRFTIDDREHLARQATDIFTAAVRKDIAHQDGFFCRDQGLMYGDGTVWVTVVPASGGRPERYVVSTVNVPESGPTPPQYRALPEIKQKCIAPANTVLVDDVGNALRYRSWHKGRQTSTKPELVLVGGTETIDGSHACEHAIYTFKNGDTTYEVSGLGCSDGTEPNGATGRLTVSRGGKQLAQWFCRDDGD